VLAAPVEIAHVRQCEDLPVELAGGLARDRRLPVAALGRGNRVPPQKEAGECERKDRKRERAAAGGQCGDGPQAQQTEDAGGCPADPSGTWKAEPKRKSRPSADRRDENQRNQNRDDRDCQTAQPPALQTRIAQTPFAGGVSRLYAAIPRSESIAPRKRPVAPPPHPPPARFGGSLPLPQAGEGLTAS